MQPLRFRLFAGLIRDPAPQRIMVRMEHQTSRSVKATCANSGANAEVRIRIATNEPQSWIDLQIAVSGDPPCEVVLSPESAADLARAIDDVRSAFLNR